MTQRAPIDKEAADQGAADAPGSAAPAFLWPDKKLLRIGEVAKLLGVENHVVRFWLQHFRAVRPERSDSGRLLFGRPAVERLARIRDLLYGQGYTIAGARRALAEPVPVQATTAAVATSAAASARAVADAAERSRREAELAGDVARLELEVRALQARLHAAEAGEAAAKTEVHAARARYSREWEGLADQLGDLAAEIRG